MLYINYVHLDAQETKDYLFIGDSFFSYYSMPEKFKSNFEETNGVEISVDGSLHDGYNFSWQIETNADLHEMLRTTHYKTIIIESSSLLKPLSMSLMSSAINKLIELAPKTEKIILVPVEGCFYFPLYSCERIMKVVECNIYPDCLSLEDTLNAVSLKLIHEFEDLDILPFFHLKEQIKHLNFPKKDDEWGHPTDELQEVLARFLVFWLADPQENYTEKFAEIWLHDNYKTLTKEMMDIILQNYITLSKFKSYD